MAESRKVVIVGIPGVGKTTLVARIVEGLSAAGRTVRVASFGSVMFEEARKAGVTDRDQLRKLPVAEQQRLQSRAAEAIAAMTEDYVVVDTHAFISTPSGYYPGLPEHVLRAVRPSSFVSVYAKPEDIYNRRLQDATRSRDRVSLDGIKNELAFHQSMISTCSVICGTPVKAVQNAEGKVEEAARRVIAAVVQ